MATSYSNPGGTGGRRGFIVATGSGNLGGSSGNPDRLINGAIVDSEFWWSTALDNTRWLKWDFGFDEYVIDELKFYESSNTSHGVWQFQGSHDNSSWTNIDSTFTLGSTYSGGVAVHAFANSTRYRYYRLLGVSGSTNGGPWIREFEFKISRESWNDDDGTVDFSNSLGTGDRSGSITISNTMTVAGGSVASLIDGNVAEGTSGLWVNPSAGQYIRFDFGSNKRIDMVRMIFTAGGLTGGGSYVLKWQGSADASSWTDLGGSESPTTQNTTDPGYFRALGAGAANAYRYFRLYHVSGTFSERYFSEFEFRIGNEAGISGSIASSAPMARAQLIASVPLSRSATITSSAPMARSAIQAAVQPITSLTTTAPMARAFLEATTPPTGRGLLSLLGVG